MAKDMLRQRLKEKVISESVLTFFRLMYVFDQSRRFLDKAKKKKTELPGRSNSELLTTFEGRDHVPRGL